MIFTDNQQGAKNSPSVKKHRPVGFEEDETQEEQLKKPIDIKSQVKDKSRFNFMKPKNNSSEPSKE